MSDSWEPRSDSPWSSEREQARRLRGEPENPTTPAPAPSAESATEGRESAFKIPRSRGGPRRQRGSSGRSSSPASEPRPSEGSSRQIGPTPPTADSGAPPSGSLPDLPGSSGGGSGGNRVLILGALLFLGMAAIAVLPRLLGDEDEADPTPTPQLIQTPTPASAERGSAPTPQDEQLVDAEYTVCIDAGHGGWDTGRVREANSRAPAIVEKEINLGMAWMMKDRLEARGIGVVMTRPSGLAVNVFNEDVNGDGQTLQDSQQAGDRDELQARINVCNGAGADLLVSLHLNGFDDPAARGYEVIYTPAPFRDFGGRNADLSTFLYREIGAAYEEVGFETTPRGILPDTDLDAEMHAYGSERHLVMTGPGVQNTDYTIEPSQMPGAVIEPVFITNDDDASFIALPENQGLLVEAYVRGIVTYFEQYPEAP